MYTYLGIEELIQEGRELQWVATAFEELEMPAETQALYAAWLTRVRQALAGRIQPDGGWVETPTSGRAMARAVDQVLAILHPIKGVSTEEYGPKVSTEVGARAGSVARRED